MVAPGDFFTIFYPDPGFAAFTSHEDNVTFFRFFKGKENCLFTVFDYSDVVFFLDDLKGTGINFFHDGTRIFIKRIFIRDHDSISKRSGYFTNFFSLPTIPTTTGGTNYY